MRVHGGEVESLTAATQSGIGVRAWIGHRVGYAYGTDLSEAGVAAIAARAAEAARGRRRGRVRGAAAAGRGRGAGRARATPRSPTPAAERVAELALAVERTALAADPRVAGVEQAVYADSAERVAIASSAGVAGEYESSSCFAYLQALAEGEGGRETGLGFGLARGPDGLDPEAIGAEGASRALAMIGAAKPASRSCPVVLDPTVAASFAGLIGGALGAGAVQRGRSPFAGRLGEELASEAFVLHDDGRDPAGRRLGSVRRRGRAAPPHGADRGRPPARLPLRHLHRQPRGRPPRPAPPPASGYRSLPSVSASNLVVAPGELRWRAAAGGGRRGRLRHRRRRPALGRQPGHRGLLGRRLGAGDPRRRAGRAGPRVHDRRRSGLDAGRGSRRRRGGRAGCPFGGSVSTPPLLIGEMAISGCQRHPDADAVAAVRLRPIFNPRGGFRRDQG